MAENEAIKLLLTPLFFIFGSLLGSFSNVVILRMASGKSVIFPPSACPSCNHRLHAIDLIPVLSWLTLGGRCRYCRASIAWQYPVVEACMAMILGFSYLKAGLGLAFIILAGRSAIWFVASVLFLRNEVQSPNPFAWAVIFYVYLNFPLGVCPFVDRRVLVIPVIAAVIAYLASFRNDQTNDFAWGCLSFIFIYSLLAKFALFAAIPVVIAGILGTQTRTRRAAHLFFFALQIIAIIMSIT